MPTASRRRRATATGCTLAVTTAHAVSARDSAPMGRDYRGWNPAAVLAIGSGTVVTNKTQASHLLIQYSDGSGAARDRGSVDFGYGTALGDSRSVGQRVINDGETRVSHRAARTDGVSSGNGAGVSAGGEWETKHIFGETADIEVHGRPPGHYRNGARTAGLTISAVHQ